MPKLALLGLNINLISELIMIVAIIIGTTIGAVISSRRDRKFNSRVLDSLAIIIMLVYLIDLIMPIIIGKIYVERIPFTIATVLTPLIIVSRFVRPFDEYKSTVAMLAICSIFVYFLYPNPFLEEEAFRIRNLQVFNYLGLCFSYGIIAIASGEVSFNIKKCYRTAIALLAIESWALILKYLFISVPGDLDNVRLLLPYLSSTSNIIFPSIMLLIVSFLICLVIFGIYYLAKLIANRHKK